MKIAILEVGVDSLLNRLDLPNDTKIINCRISFERPYVIEFFIESDALAEVNKACFVPIVNAVYDEGGFVKFK